MKTKMTIKTILLCFLLLPVAGAMAASPQSAPPAPQAQAAPAGPKTILDFKAQLGLTDDQTVALSKAMEDFQMQMMRLQGKLQVSQVDLMDLLDKKGELQAIHAKLIEAADLRADMQFAQIEASRKVSDVLTPAQAAKWRDILQNSRAQAPEAPLPKHPAKKSH